MHGMILAAGMGSRLGSLSAERPKPMLPVCNQPLIVWAVKHCVSAGISDLTINLHHLGSTIEAEIKTGTHLGAHVRYSHETELLGTGGGIKHMADALPRETCVVYNGKIVTDVNLKAVLAFHRANQALATMVLHPVADPERWGAIGIDQEKRVVRMLDRRHRSIDPVELLMFTGIHVLEPELIDEIPANEPCCIIRTAYTKLFEREAPIFGYVHRGYFMEHSTVDRYLKGNNTVLEGNVYVAHAPSETSGVSPSAIIHPTAKIVHPVLIGERAIVQRHAIVGPFATLGHQALVLQDVHLKNAIVWDNATVGQTISDAVVTKQGIAQCPKSDSTSFA